MTNELRIIDHTSGNEIRKTDNSMKDCDLPGINQVNEPLELDENGLPVGWNPPEVDDNGNS